MIQEAQRNNKFWFGLLFEVVIVLRSRVFELCHDIINSPLIPSTCRDINGLGLICLPHLAHRLHVTKIDIIKRGRLFIGGSITAN